LAQAISDHSTFGFELTAAGAWPASCAHPAACPEACPDDNWPLRDPPRHCAAPICPEGGERNAEVLQAQGDQGQLRRRARQSGL